MISNRFLLIGPLSVALLAADVQTWKDKPIPEWTDDETKQVLNESPWVKTVQPTVDRSNGGQSPNRGMGRRGGIGMGGIGVGLPGGMGRRGGMGYPGGGNSGGNRGSNGSDYSQPPTLKLRWESALPVRAAELKTRETNAPTLDDDKHYAIAVYGVPDRLVTGDTKSLAGQLKKQAVIKRDGKKDFKPSSVEVLQREDGPVFLYLFPRSTEIAAKDKLIEFDAKILRFHLKQPFDLDQMQYRGKLEL